MGAALRAGGGRRDDRLALGNAQNADVQEAADDESEEQHDGGDKDGGVHSLNLPQWGQRLKKGGENRARVLKEVKEVKELSARGKEEKSFGSLRSLRTAILAGSPNAPRAEWRFAPKFVAGRLRPCPGRRDTKS